MRRPFLEAFAAIALLSAMDAAIKSLVARLPVIEVAFLRYLIGSVAMTAIVAVARPGWPRTDTIRANALRALLVVITATTFFYGLGVLPLAEALILSFMSPIFTAAFAVLLLRETVDRRIALALAAGFTGVIVIVAGGQAGPGAPIETSSTVWGAAAVVLSAVTYSASNVLLRARARRDPLLLIVLIQNVAPALILAGPAVFVWEGPSPAEWARLALVGSLGVSGHLLLARAYAGAEATRLAPFDYTALIWAVLFGFFLFGEIPTVWALGGAALIAAGAALGSRR